MEEEPSTPSDTTVVVPESPKPLAFTIDFGQSHDTQRHKALVEKFQNRHRRGQSLSKLEDTPQQAKKHPSTGNLPRKSSFQSEGYFSSDENKNVRAASNNLKLRSELSLPLKNLASGADKMTQSFPNGSFLDTIRSPEIEIKNISSPETDVSPVSVKDKSKLATPSPVANIKKLVRHLSSPEVENRLLVVENEEKFVDGNDFDFDKSDTVSDAGTYTLDTDNYTEEQKARMSIDRDFNIEQISFMKKTEEYIQSLTITKEQRPRPTSIGIVRSKPQEQVLHPNIPEPSKNQKALSPILSPTQNLSIVDVDTTINKILYPSPKSKTGINFDGFDQGCFTSVTSSGAFSRKDDSKRKGHTRQPSLTKSEVQIQTYVDVGCTHSNGVVQTQTPEEPVANLPPAIGGISGKSSPTKIPSPLHTSLTRPRSRNSVSSLNIDLSDSSLETESFLKPTQNYINSLQKKISLDSDQDSDYDSKNNLRLNNETRDLLKQKSLHVRHNSFDDQNIKISNKLEHFQNKNLQGIDQTYTNKLNQYSQKVHKLQNSPNNSPIRRSSSFSNKNQFINQPKVSNLGTTKDVNIRNSPNLNQNGSIQRSSSTASIKPNLLQPRRLSTEHTKIDRNQFGDTESSSEEDFDKNLKKKDLSNITNTRYNRAFSLRRARLDSDQPFAKCPNTPEMRRKFQPSEHLRSERAISVDRRPIKTNEVPSRYLQSISKNKTVVPEKIEIKNVPKPSANVIKSLPGKPQVFSRTDSGRFSVRSTTKPLSSNTQKSNRKDGGGKKQSGGRSNSSLSSREVEFQNWKRRKSYDPMKAAAEGKKKAELAKKQNLNPMTQSYNENQDCDSSPSHSSSVHRSQSFHGTAAIEQLISSEEDDLTLSADECFSPPTPSPCELSPARNKIRHAWRDRLLH
ncbi:hypothetical protein RN001_015327 [Aquatica leii]|uniref:Uncharacterized protein n=1 Tax=Aquatica leii TaxID=1421715 RepID=A0AAN7SL39_9COLE|nr:hypothetical protein RN001_015327 [Aquatica leii]